MNNPSRRKGSARAASGLFVASKVVACEALEARQLLSVSMAPRARSPVFAQPTFRYALTPAGTLTPAASSPSGITPQQMRRFYALDALNFNGVSGDGSGQTIALIDAFGAPTMQSDLQAFDAHFGIPDPPSFKAIDQYGGTNLPSAQTRGSNDWYVETSLDVEWAHVIAPKANILLVECNSNDDANLYQGAATASRQPGVAVVSMSFGSGEYFGESANDYNFNTPAGHQGVTFVASTGDEGSPGDYPAYAPNVLAVGGTTVHLGGGGAYGSEEGWGSGGGGISSGYEREPAYQRSVQTTGNRSTPDVSIDANPSTGVPVYDSYDYPASPWVQLGGTSLAAPMWAAIIALADQARATVGLSSFDGAANTLPRLYALPRSDFHDITSGSNGDFNAAAGYDEVTGLGTPIGDLLVPDLAMLPPANDNIAHAATITGPQATVHGSNVRATLESGEPLNTSNSSGNTIWYSWTAPANAGQVRISTAGSAFDTTLGVYTGTSAPDLVQVGANDNNPAVADAASSLVTFTATPGTTYLISIDGTTTSSPQTGATVLTLSAAAANDNFADAASLSGATAADIGFNFNATAEAGEPNSTNISGADSVWWNWTAPQDVGYVTVDTQGSDFANTLGVYTGDAPSALASVASASSDANNTSTVSFAPIPLTTYHIMVNGVLDTGTGQTSQGNIHINLAASPPPTAYIMGRYVFYNDSSFDGWTPGAGASDGAAIAPDKHALLPGQTATFADYTSYSKGINGIMVDLSAAVTHASISAADFGFRTGNGGDPSTWSDAPAPLSVTDLPGAGIFGADRIEVVWADGAIRNQWLQVTVKSDVMTGLTAPDVFYFGNLVGESGNSTSDAIVDSADELGARNDPHTFLNPAGLTNVHDYNRDGRVDAADQLIARNSFTDAAMALSLWTAPLPLSSTAMQTSQPMFPAAAPGATSTTLDPTRLVRRRAAPARSAVFAALLTRDFKRM